MTNTESKKFRYVPGQNDAEYIEFLKSNLNRAIEINGKAVERIKQLTAKVEELNKRTVPERPAEEVDWVVSIGPYGYHTHCKGCGYTVEAAEESPLNLLDVNYCPKCGGKIKR